MRVLRLAIAALSLAAVEMPAEAQIRGRNTVEGASVVPTEATTNLIAPVSITSNQDLVLSTVFTPRVASGSTVTGISAVTTSGVGQVSGGLVAVAAPTPAQATFTVAGQDGQSISVAVPQAVELNRVGGSETLTVATSTDLLGMSGSQLITGALGGNGLLSFNVGGRVSLDSSAVAGTYNGLLIVTAQYN